MKVWGQRAANTGVRLMTDTPVAESVLEFRGVLAVLCYWVAELRESWCHVTCTSEVGGQCAGQGVSWPRHAGQFRGEARLPVRTCLTLLSGGNGCVTLRKEGEHRWHSYYQYGD